MTISEPSLPDFVRSELRAGEGVRWAGRPHPMAYAIRESLFQFLFGVFWSAILASFMGAKFENGSPGLFLIPFVLVGVWMVTTPFREYYRALRTTYVVTNERAIIFNGLLTSTVRSFDPGQIGPIEVEARGFGGGAVYFFRDIVPTRRNQRTVRVGFVAIADPKGAEAALVELGRAQ